jgi:putative flippase GtrA
VILVLLHNLFSFNIFLAQLIAAEVALFSNFILHHNWTYKHNKVKKSIVTLLIQFHATSWPAILGSAVMVSIFESVFGFNEFLSLIGSSLIALFWNFGWSKYVVWRRVTEKQIQEIAK